MGTPDGVPGGRQPAAVPVLYGSQTGNAQDVAERLGRELAARGVPSAVASTAAYDVRGLPGESVACFVCSTTGQGEVPTGMRAFWRFLLRKGLPADSLAGLEFAVFGLGDSGYQQFNAVAKKLERRLAQLGARRLVATGLGDDQHPLGYEGARGEWVRRLLQALKAHRSGQWAHVHLAGPGAGGVGPPKYAVALQEAAPGGPCCVRELCEGAWVLDAAEAARNGGAPATRPPSDATGWHARRPFPAAVLANERITAADHFQDVRHVELDLGGPGVEGMEYAAGDVLGVFPRTPDAAVDRFFRRIGHDPDVWASVGPGGQRVRLRALVQGALDISSAPPRRYFFEVLAECTDDEREKDRLAYFGSAEGMEDLYRYCQGERRTVLEVLEDFPTAAPPLARLLEIVPRLQPRYFSISSGPSKVPGRCELTVAVVAWRTRHGLRRTGLLTAWLKTQGAGAELPVWVEKGAIGDLSGSELPLILVGPGTGVAPCRALLQERREALRGRSGGGPLPEALLVFGCRHEKKDFLYRAEWEAHARAGLLPGGAVAAFSRDQAHKVYVQDKIREHGARIWGLLQRGAHVYVCGSANTMPAQVAAAFQAVAAEHGGLAPAAADAFLRRLEATRRYHVEAWS